MDLTVGDIVLCKFYFSDLQSNKLRPVIVFKDNLPFEDFIGLPISSQLHQVHDDEFIINTTDLIDGTLPKRSKVMIRKTFVISKNIIIKRYGKLTPERMQQIHASLCKYFDCCN
jgi:mRNA interferase MazF